MAREEGRGISRRTLLIGGGAGVGLLVAWSLWPRTYGPNLRAAPGETILNAFLKIASDGRVIVAVPQTELGQGVWTSLPQILADELGADWRTVSVEPAPISPLYANRLLAEAAADEAWPSLLRGAGRWLAAEYATRDALMVTGGSTSIRALEPRMREAGAAARALLMKAAARRWKADWETLDTVGGFVLNGNERLRFGELAEAAVREELPDYAPPVRGGVDNRLVGQPLPRLDLPSKVDGSAQFAGDVRLPDMVYASVHSAPGPASRLEAIDRKAATSVPGVIGMLEYPGFVAVVASNWWAANRGLERMKPRYGLSGPQPTAETIRAALAEALDQDEGSRIFERGDVGEVYAAGNVVQGHYIAGPSPSAALETLTATARAVGDRLEIWAPTQAPGIAKAEAARAAGLPPAQVTLYPTLAGGGYGRKLETKAIVQAAMIARKVKRPVQLVWSRMEESARDTFRPPARAAMTARLGEHGLILGWQTRIAAPDSAADLAGRFGSRSIGSLADPMAGAIPPYAIPAVAVDHLPAEVGVPTGAWRSGAHSYTAFFTESFVDELSRLANVEPLSFRMQMLGDNPRLARCLSTAAAVGGWDGGQRGSAMGIAGHSAFGSHAAVLVEVEIDRAQRVRVLRALCAVDCGRVINPEILKQQIEGGLVFGIAAATCNPAGFEGGRPTALNLRDHGFPLLASAPEVSVEILPSEDEPGGATELAVPLAAPAVANALFALTGQRLRELPLAFGGN
jgi:isoquinoline 1-oxidoreductase beta subunit